MPYEFSRSPIALDPESEYFHDIVADGGSVFHGDAGYAYLGPFAMRYAGLDGFEADRWSVDLFLNDAPWVQWHEWSDEPIFYVAAGSHPGQIYFDIAPIVVPEPTTKLLAIGVMCVLVCCLLARRLYSQRGF